MQQELLQGFEQRGDMICFKRIILAAVLETDCNRSRMGAERPVRRLAPEREHWGEEKWSILDNKTYLVGLFENPVRKLLQVNCLVDA